MSSPSINRLGSLFSSINKSVGSAISNLMASQHPGQTMGASGSQRQERTPILMAGSVPDYHGIPSVSPSAQHHAGYPPSAMGSRIYPLNPPSAHSAEDRDRPVSSFAHPSVMDNRSRAIPGHGQSHATLTALPPSSAAGVTQPFAPVIVTRTGDWTDSPPSSPGHPRLPVHHRQVPSSDLHLPVRLHSPSMPNVAMATDHNLPGVGITSSRQSHLAVSPRMRRGQSVILKS